MASARMYPYAVMDGNEAPDQYRLASSCHHTLAAAQRECAARNRQDPNAHFYVTAWAASRWAKERPGPKHVVDPQLQPEAR